MRKFLLISLCAFAVSACSKDESEMSGGQGPRVGEIVDDIDDSPSDKPPENSKSNPQAVGFYAEGKLINDLFFPFVGEGFLKVFRDRKRNYATDYLYSVISYGAKELQRRYPDGERVQIGDISKQGGGQLSRHASHQNGLDADLSYFRKDRREMDPEGFGGFDEVFVKNGKVTANFDVQRNYEIIKSYVSTSTVGRVFMDAQIKTKLCEYAESLNGLTDLDKETLRRMRPLENHKDHMHLRIKCPKSSPDCVTQVEPPAGTGCPIAGQVLINMFDPFELE
jgi:penicillin-insensitive murein endopeptidase